MGSVISGIAYSMNPFSKPKEYNIDQVTQDYDNSDKYQQNINKNNTQISSSSSNTNNDNNIFLNDFEKKYDDSTSDSD